MLSRSRLPLPVGDLEDCLQAVGGDLVGAEQPELGRVSLYNVPHELARHSGRL